MPGPKDGEKSNAEFAGAIVVQVAVFLEHFDEQVNGRARLSLADGLDGAAVRTCTLLTVERRKIIAQKGRGKCFHGLGRLGETGLGGGGCAGELLGSLWVVENKEGSQKACGLGVRGLGDEDLLELRLGIGYAPFFNHRFRRRNILFFLRRQRLVEPLPHGMFGKRTREFVDRAAIYDQFDSRNAAHSELLGQVRMLVRVDFDQFPAACLLGSQLFEHRAEYAARTAPRGPEVHYDRNGLAALQHIFLKVFQFVRHGMNSFAEFLAASIHAFKLMTHRDGFALSTFFTFFLLVLSTIVLAACGSGAPGSGAPGSGASGSSSGSASGGAAGSASGSASGGEAAASYDASLDSLRMDGEVHLRNVKQLTFGGNNAEAYWSRDDEHLVFQSDWDRINGQGCDQIYTMDPDADLTGSPSDYTLVSTGEGRTTCSFYLPDGRIIYGSTHAGDRACPDPVMFEQGRYVWPIYETYDIYVANADGSGTELLIGGPGYDAEATLSPDGRYIIFTSTRSGDLELWRYEMASGDLLQLTSGLGYDGGAFFSPDSQQIVWRASRPTGAAADAYRSLLADGFVEPSDMNIFVADIDGSNARQVTDLPGANWAPYFHPSGDQLLFASNHHSQNAGGRIFNIFAINVDGSNLRQITFSNTFDSFPMFSYDGTRLAFSSNRTASGPETRETNVFVADWVD